MRAKGGNQDGTEETEGQEDEKATPHSAPTNTKKTNKNVDVRKDGLGEALGALHLVDEVDVWRTKADHGRVRFGRAAGDGERDEKGREHTQRGGNVENIHKEEKPEQDAAASRD